MTKTSFGFAVIVGLFILYLNDHGAEFSAQSENYQKSAHFSGSLRVCTLNLHRLGEHKDRKANTISVVGPAFNKKLSALSKRIVEGACDIVGLQELVGSRKEDSRKILERLIEKLSQANSDKKYQAVIGESRDPRNRNAFLYDSALLTLDHQESAYRQVLPSLDPRSRSWSHSRGPLVAVFSSIENTSLSIAVINYHFKSKANGWKDASGTNFELGRLHAAAGVRELNEKVLRRTAKPVISILLGDRNTGPSGAAAEVLSGRLRFTDFLPGTSCRISEEGTALCPPETYREPDMIPVIQKKGVETGRDIGTYKRGRRIEILDEILISAKDSELIRDKSGGLMAGVVGEYRKGSDHLMSWVGIRLK